MVIERLKQFIDAKGLTNKSFEQMVGLSNGAIGKALKGMILGIDKLENVLTVFPDLNPTWLMTGKGDMFWGVYELEKEVERLREENRRLREVKLPVTEVTPMAELFMRFMDNQRQYNELMELMMELYKKAK